MTQAFLKPVKPRDCGLAFGLTLEEAGFRHELEAASTKDWVKHFSRENGDPLPDALWADFYVPDVVDPSSQLIDIARQLGVTVYRACSLSQFCEAATRHTVVTLVSHWLEDGAIELSDGIFGKNDVAAALPVGYGGVLDLTICQSVLLADEVKKQHPDCYCMCNAKPVRLRPKLFLYGQTLIALNEGRLPYPDALFATYRKHMNGKRK